MAKKDDPSQGHFKQEIEKLKDQALNVFNALVQEAVEKMNDVDDDLKKRMAEELKKSEKDIKALDKLCRDTQTKVILFRSKQLNLFFTAFLLTILLLPF